MTRSSFYAWKEAAAARAERAAADADLEARIRKIHAADNTVGAPRVTAELNDGAPAAERVNHKHVARVMKAAGITGYVKKRKVRTTVPEPSEQKVPDLLNRDFTAPAPNLRYVGDIIYLPLAEAAGGGNLYLATVIDCYSHASLAGRSPTTCAPSSSKTRSRPPPPPEDRSPGRSSTATTGRRLHLKGLRQALRRLRRHPVHGRRRVQC